MSKSAVTSDTTFLIIIPLREKTKVEHHTAVGIVFVSKIDTYTPAITSNRVGNPSSMTIHKASVTCFLAGAC